MSRGDEARYRSLIERSASAVKLDKNFRPEPGSGRLLVHDPTRRTDVRRGVLCKDEGDGDGL